MPGRRILSMPFQQDLDDRCNAFETWQRDKLFCFSCGGGPKFGAQISYPKHTWSSVKLDHQIVNFGCRRIKEYSGHTDSRGVLVVPPGTCFHPDMIGNEPASWLGLVGCENLSNNVCFNGNPSARFWMISIKVSLCGLLPGMTSLNYITCRPRFRWSNVWFLVFLAKHQRHLHLKKITGFLSCSDPFLLQLVITSYYPVRSGVTFPDFPIVPRAAWVRQDSLSQARGPQSHDAWDEKGPNFGGRIAVAQGQIYKQKWGLLLLIYLFGGYCLWINSGVTIYEILYIFWQTTTKTRNEAERWSFSQTCWTSAILVFPNNNQYQIILLIGAGCWRFQPWSLHQSLHHGSHGFPCLDEQFLRKWQIWIPWSLLGPHFVPADFVQRFCLWRSGTSAGTSGHRSAGCSRCRFFLGHWLL